MKPYALALLAIVALTSLGIFLVARSSVPAPVGPVVIAPPPKFAPPTVPTLPSPNPATATPPRTADQVPSPAVNPAPLVLSPRDPTSPSPAASDNDPLASERAAIQALATSNNPANVPAIARYLEHADAGIRQEAVLGLITLGEKAGAPFLTAATVKARTPEEADTLREAADFLTKGVKDTRVAPPEPDVTNDPSPQDLMP